MSNSVQQAVQHAVAVHAVHSATLCNNHHQPTDVDASEMLLWVGSVVATNLCSALCWRSAAVAADNFGRREAAGRAGGCDGDRGRGQGAGRRRLERLQRSALCDKIALHCIASFCNQILCGQQPACAIARVPGAGGLTGCRGAPCTC